MENHEIPAKADPSERGRAAESQLAALFEKSGWHVQRHPSHLGPDLVARRKGIEYAIEIKSAATFAPEFHKGIARFRNALGGRVGPGAVLYTGDQRLQFKETEVLNPLVHDGLDRLACPSLRSARE